MKTLIKLLLIFSLYINTSYSQENTEEKKEVATPQKDEKEKIDWSSAKMYNVRVSPLGLLLGQISGTLDFKVRSDLTVGPSLSLFSLTVGSTSVSSFSFGGEAVYAPNGDIGKDGWIASAHASYGSFSMEETYSSVNYEASVGILSIGGLYGYQWMWESFNIQTGAGLSFYSADGTIELESSSGQTRSITNPVGSGISLGLKFTIGWKL